MFKYDTLHFDVWANHAVSGSVWPWETWQDMVSLLSFSTLQCWSGNLLHQWNKWDMLPGWLTGRCNPRNPKKSLRWPNSKDFRYRKHNASLREPFSGSACPCMRGSKISGCTFPSQAISTSASGSVDQRISDCHEGYGQYRSRLLNVWESSMANMLTHVEMVKNLSDLIHAPACGLQLIALAKGPDRVFVQSKLSQISGMEGSTVNSAVSDLSVLTSIPGESQLIWPVSSAFQ